jgi:hypothetical protein
MGPRTVYELIAELPSSTAVVDAFIRVAVESPWALPMELREWIERNLFIEESTPNEGIAAGSPESAGIAEPAPADGETMASRTPPPPTSAGQRVPRRSTPRDDFPRNVPAARAALEERNEPISPSSLARELEIHRHSVANYLRFYNTTIEAIKRNEWP